jgi:hypothetical protein
MAFCIWQVFFYLTLTVRGGLRAIFLSAEQGKLSVNPPTAHHSRSPEICTLL